MSTSLLRPRPVAAAPHLEAKGSRQPTTGGAPSPHGSVQCAHAPPDTPKHAALASRCDPGVPRLAPALTAPRLLSCEPYRTCDESPRYMDVGVMPPVADAGALSRNPLRRQPHTAGRSPGAGALHCPNSTGLVGPLVSPPASVPHVQKDGQIASAAAMGPRQRRLSAVLHGIHQRTGGGRQNGYIGACAAQVARRQGEMPHLQAMQCGLRRSYRPNRGHEYQDPVPRDNRHHGKKRHVHPVAARQTPDSTVPRIYS